MGTRWELGGCQLEALGSRVIHHEVARGGVAQPAEEAHLSDGDLAASDPIGGVVQPAEVPLETVAVAVAGEEAEVAAAAVAVVAVEGCLAALVKWLPVAAWIKWLPVVGSVKWFPVPAWVKWWSVAA